jgi:hypothetical protein
MRFTRLVSAPLDGVVRSGTPFSSGVLAIGTVERLDDDSFGLPVRSGPVIARISKGVGLPTHLPDIAGLALRLPTTVGPPWDLLMASAAGRGPWQRRLLKPVREWNDAVFSGLTPFEHNGIGWWVRARYATSIGTRGLSLDGIADVLHRDGIEIALTQAPGNQEFRTLAWLTLRGIHQEEAADVEEAQHRLADLRPFEKRTASD